MHILLKIIEFRTLIICPILHIFSDEQFCVVFCNWQKIISISADLVGTRNSFVIPHFVHVKQMRCAHLAEEYMISYNLCYIEL
jgi:hypothetical protein